jgi:NAD(P)-dependent dehydrogenase (short-subunit alcohol dehydrogenase family)
MANAFDVSGKNVVITGGNRGIGKALPWLTRNPAPTLPFSAAIMKAGRKRLKKSSGMAAGYTCVLCDVANLASVKAAVKKVFQFFDHVDILINNAGVATTVPFLDGDQGLSEWHRVIDTDLHGVANVIHEIAPSMRDKGLGGSIINISSVGGQRVSGAREHHNAPYHAAKAGLDIFTKYLAIVLGDYGIRVNVMRRVRCIPTWTRIYHRASLKWLKRNCLPTASGNRLKSAPSAFTSPVRPAARSRAAFCPLTAVCSAFINWRINIKQTTGIAHLIVADTRHFVSPRKGGGIFNS